MTGLPSPLAAEHAGYLLVEVGTDDVEAHADGSLFDGLTAAVSRLDGVRDATLAADAAGMARLWRYRESHTEAIALAGRPVKLDVSVPTGVLAAFVAGLDAVVAAAVTPAARTGVRVVAFGHLAEGNLHVNVLGLDADESAAVTDAVLRQVAGLGGSISAEHGVGRAKVGWLPLSRTRDEIAAMTAVKRALDPTGMLAPGVLLPPSTPVVGDEEGASA